ncbi:Vam6/VPS39/TRAP1 family like protein, partial [Aduncisulcus paluster]
MNPLFEGILINLQGSKIESLAVKPLEPVFEPKLSQPIHILACTTDGQLNIYSCDLANDILELENEEGKKLKTLETKLEDKKRFAPGRSKGASQIRYIHEINTIVCMYDGTLSVVSGDEYKLKRQILETKGCQGYSIFVDKHSSLAKDPDDPVHSVFVCTWLKKELSIFEWDGFSFSLSHSHTFSDTIKNVYGGAVGFIVATRSSYASICAWDCDIEVIDAPMTKFNRVACEMTTGEMLLSMENNKIQFMKPLEGWLPPQARQKQETLKDEEEKEEGSDSDTADPFDATGTSAASQRRYSDIEREEKRKEEERKMIVEGLYNTNGECGYIAAKLEPSRPFSFNLPSDVVLHDIVCTANIMIFLCNKSTIYRFIGGYPVVHSDSKAVVQSMCPIYNDVFGRPFVSSKAPKVPVHQDYSSLDIPFPLNSSGSHSTDGLSSFPSMCAVLSNPIASVFPEAPSTQGTCVVFFQGRTMSESVKVMSDQSSFQNAVCVSECVSMAAEAHKIQWQAEEKQREEEKKKEEAERGKKKLSVAQRQAIAQRTQVAQKLQQKVHLQCVRANRLLSLSHALRGYELFRTNDHEEAMRSFMKSLCDPRCVLRLYTGLIDVSVGVQAAVRAGHARDVQRLEPELVGSYVYTQSLTYLQSYLTQWRSLQRPKEEITSALCQCVDTATFRVHVKIATSDDAPPQAINVVRLFCKGANQADAAVVEELLSQSRMYYEYTLFLRTRGDHKKAVDVLLDNRLYDKISEYLIWLGAGYDHELKKKEDLEKGGNSSISPLSSNATTSISDEGIMKERDALLEECLKIHHYALPQLFKKFPQQAAQEALKIYRSEPPAYVRHVPIVFSANLLEECEVTNTHMIELLEHDIIRKQSSNSQAHERLLSRYLLDIICAYDEQKSEALRVVQGDFCVPGSERGDLGRARRRVLLYLRKYASKGLKAADVLKWWPHTFLLEERAEMLRLSEENMLALKLLARVLCRPDAAEVFCNVVCRQQQLAKAPTPFDIFFTLVNVYLQPVTPLLKLRKRGRKQLRDRVKAGKNLSRGRLAFSGTCFLHAVEGWLIDTADLEDFAFDYDEVEEKEASDGFGADDEFEMDDGTEPRQSTPRETTVPVGSVKLPPIPPPDEDIMGISLESLHPSVALGAKPDLSTALLTLCRHYIHVDSRLVFTALPDALPVRELRPY